MASPIWNLAFGVEQCARDINDFLYEKGSPRSKKIEHTYEELEEELEAIRKALWRLYDEVSQAQGWSE